MNTQPKPLTAAALLALGACQPREADRTAVLLGRAKRAKAKAAALRAEAARHERIASRFAAEAARLTARNG